MRKIWWLIPAMTLVATACGDDADSGEPSAPTQTSSPSIAPTSTTAPDVTTRTTQPATAAEPATAVGWSISRLGTGIKPVLAIDGENRPAIAWLVEALDEGFVALAAASDGWTEDRFVEGYFYGPIGLDFDPNGDPHVVYHDHQADTFQPELGDLTHAVRVNGAWTITAASDDGHDGWDSTVAIGPDGVVRAAGIDPQQFERTEGVEYYELGNAGWEVSAIGSGPIEYEWNVALAVSDTGTVAVSYFDNKTTDLVYAEQSGTGWDIEVVDSEGDTGRFSSLAFDDAGVAHISYFRADTGVVRYATRTGDEWRIEDVGALEAVELGFIGARRLTAIDVDSTGTPYVVFGDVAVVRHAARGEAGWEVSEVAAAGARPFGQLVTFALDGTDRPHIATYEGSAADPSEAVILYLTTE